MRLRWIFHQQMLGQSMQFYQDEFSGRVSAKVMQTALAVRDVVMTLIGVFVFILTFLVGAGAVLTGIHPLLTVPFVFLDFSGFGFIGICIATPSAYQSDTGGCSCFDDRSNYRCLC